MSARSGARSSSWTVCLTTTPRMIVKLRGMLDPAPCTDHLGLFGRRALAGLWQCHLSEEGLCVQGCSSTNNTWSTSSLRRQVWGIWADAGNLPIPFAEPISFVGWLFFSSPFKRPDLTEIDPTKKAPAQDQHYNNVRPSWKHYLGGGVLF